MAQGEAGQALLNPQGLPSEPFNVRALVDAPERAWCVNVMKPSQVYEAIAKVIADAPRVTSLAQFDEAVRQHEEAWRNVNGASPKLWFRGHADATWQLSPPALRGKRQNPEIDMHGFIEFRRRAFGLIDPAPSTDWDWLYLAQHHGFPTRLLDWSEASHIGLFFALCQRDLDDDSPKEPCVWVLNPGELNERNWGFKNVVKMGPHQVTNRFLNPYRHGTPALGDSGTGPEPIAVIPEYVTPRLRGQRGAFVAFAEDALALARGIVTHAMDRPPLATPLVIDTGSLESMEAELIVAGAGHSAVFPDITGLCEEIARRRTLGRF